MERVSVLLTELSSTQKVIYAVSGVVVTVVSAIAITRLFRRKVKIIYPRNTVVLHLVGRGPYAPSMTPFAVKLETYLRIAKIPYQNVHDFKMSPKGKVPWIEYNDETVGDTTIIIDYLNNTLGIDLNKHLSPVERAIAHSMKIMTEEHLYWCLALFRWVHKKESTLFKMAKIPPMIAAIFGFKMQRAAFAQGLGRHSVEELRSFMKKDLQAISDYLGKKDFLMGDNPCEEDCAVFGLLSQLYWHSHELDAQRVFTVEYPILAAYCERMKTTFWPDWDECITHGGTREATK